MAAGGFKEFVGGGDHRREVRPNLVRTVASTLILPQVHQARGVLKITALLNQSMKRFLKAL
jgi:hypothetical protein